MPDIRSVNDTSFINFFNKTRLEIENIQKAHGFTGQYRRLPGGIKYDTHLTPPIRGLRPEQQMQIGSNSIFALKSKNQISSKISPITYDAIFDFADDTNTMGNQNHITNILRCLYDLSFRYQGNELFVKAQAIVIGYVKHYKVEVTFYSIIDILNGITSFFNVQPTQLNDLVTRLKFISAQKNLTDLELAVLQEFIYICPPPETLQYRMRLFYDDLFSKINDPFADALETAAWIIKTFCDIHPFDDGNGRVARTLACNLIRDKMGINFTDAEIINFGMDQYYKNITSRMHAVSELVTINAIKGWLSVICRNKLNSDGRLSLKPGF